MGGKFTVVVVDEQPADLQLVRRCVEEAGGEFLDVSQAPEDEFEMACREAHGVLVSRKHMDRDVILGMPNLRVIARAGVGVDHIDREAASERGILVLNSPSYGMQEVSDYAIGLLMMSARHIAPMSRSLRDDGQWNWGPPGPVLRMSNCTAAIIGLGTIGQESARKLGPMVKRVIAYDPYLKQDTARERHAELVDTLEEACAAEYIVIHAPYLKPDTHHLIGKDELALMPREGHVVNVARGELVDMDALVEALDAGALGGAALDVYGGDKNPPDEPLPIWRHDKVICTPHSAWYSETARVEMMMESVRDMAATLSGQRPAFVTNPEVLKDEPWFADWADASIPSVSWQIERLRRQGTVPR
jgi:D-3-phosphoglycerate dehydrogenase